MLRHRSTPPCRAAAPPSRAEPWAWKEESATGLYEVRCIASVYCAVIGPDEAARRRACVRDWLVRLLSSDISVRPHDSRILLLHQGNDALGFACHDC